MVAIPGTTVQVGHYYMPVKSMAGASFELVGGKREISDVIGDLNSVEFNLKIGDYKTVLARLDSARDCLIENSVLSADGKVIDSKPGQIESILSRYENLRERYDMLTENNQN